MTDTKFELGEILKVSRKSNTEDYWYEKVVQVQPEVITEDMPEDAEADISKQGLTENFNYEVVETFKISSALKALHQAKIISSNLPVMPSLPDNTSLRARAQDMQTNLFENIQPIEVRQPALRQADVSSRFS